MYMEIVHFVINIFASGRSEIKVYLFLIYCISLFALYFLYPYFKKPVRPHLILLYASLSFIFIVGIVLQIKLTSDLGVGITDSVIVYRNNELSTSALSHVHVMKGSMGIILSLFGNGVYRSLDGGTAYLGLFPSILYIAGVAALLLAIIGFFFLYLHTCNKFPERSKLLYIFTFSIFSFSIVKNSIDGGLLNGETIPALIGLYLITRQKSKEQSFAPFLYLCMLAIVLPLLQLAEIPGISVLTLPRFIAMTSLVVLLSYFNIFTKRNIFVSCIILLASLYGIYRGTELNRVILMYADLELKAGTQVFVYTKENILHNTLRKEFAIGELNVYEGVLDTKTTILDLAGLAKTPTNFYPVAVPELTCSLEEQNIPGEFVVHLKKDLSDDQKADILNDTHTFFRVTKIVEQTNTNTSYFSYKIYISRNPCSTRLLELIEQFFIKHGVREMYITHIL